MFEPFIYYYLAVEAILLIVIVGAYLVVNRELAIRAHAAARDAARDAIEDENSITPSPSSSAHLLDPP
jgi:hypothetical protein